MTQTALAEDSTRTIIQGMLQPDERILWTGKPNPLSFAIRERKRFIYSAIACVVIILLAISVAPTWGALPAGGIALIVIIVLLAEFAWNGLLGTKTVYGVTDQRVIFYQQPFLFASEDVVSRTPKTLEQRTAPIGKDLLMGTELYVEQVVGSTPQPQQPNKIAAAKVRFFGLTDADTVEGLIRSQFNLTA